MPLIRWLLNVQPLWNNPADYNAALQYLPASTHARIQSYHRQSDRKLALGSQLLQHLLVTRHRNTPFADVSITRHHCGLSGARPVFDGIDGSDGLEYSVSHHGTVVALVSRLQPPRQTAKEEGSVGVDVLEYAELPSYVCPTLPGVVEWAEGFVDSGVFTHAEMMGVRDVARRDAWREVVKEVHLRWTVKEAFVKALGTGLATDLQAIEVRLEGVREQVEEGRRVPVEVWLGKEGEKRRADEWYFEIGLVAEGSNCVGVATRVEGLLEEEKSAEWQWLDYNADVLAYIMTA
ncbi:hypothetical protein TWF696_008255 [Orbilia brochopaga]|uniref:holo-[acyl-carrier-protein] synthase n=1 Tax=Orbilia brochopaga TaxID=3140254 RepID=A0AAV9UFU0_9PEZI